MYEAVGKSYREVSPVILKKPLKEPINFRKRAKAVMLNAILIFVLISFKR